MGLLFVAHRKDSLQYSEIEIPAKLSAAEV